jgi:hypothetical protein
MENRIRIPIALLAAVFAFAAGPDACAAGGPGIKLAQVIANAPLPDDVPYDIRPNQWGNDYILSYVVKADGLAGIDGDSLEVETATAGGTDIATTASGEPAWRIVRMPEPCVSSDGRWGGFAIEIKTGGAAKGVVPVVHGSIDVLCSSGVSEEIVPLSVEPGSSVEVGGLTFEATRQRDLFPGGSAGSDPMPEVGSWKGNSTAETEMISLSPGEKFGVKVEGNPPSLVSVEIVDGGEIRKSTGFAVRSTTTNGVMTISTTYLFPEPSSGTVELKVNFREGTSRQTLRF